MYDAYSNAFDVWIHVILVKKIYLVPVFGLHVYGPTKVPTSEISAWTQQTLKRILDSCSLSSFVDRILATVLKKESKMFKFYGQRTVREKGRDLTQSYYKSPYTNRNVKRAKWQHNQRHIKVRLHSGCGLRLRTVSWSNYGHPTGVVNLVYGPNLPTPHNSRVIKRTHV